MRRTILAAVLPALLLLASSASADVRLTISNGQVTLSAKDATLRQILAEWARVGQTTIVNAERVTGTPVTLELAGVSEEQALDVILRSVSGYLAAPRSDTSSNASRYDRILLLPTSTGTRASATPAVPAFQQPQFNPQRVDEDDDEGDEPPVPGTLAMPNGAPGSPRGPIFNAFPQPGATRVPVPQPVPQSAPQPMPQPAPQPSATGQPAPAPAGVFVTPAFGPGVRMSPGVAVPGMVVPAPQPQPGAQGAIQEP